MPLRAEPPLEAMEVTISADRASAALEAVINFQSEHRRPSRTRNFGLIGHVSHVDKLTLRGRWLFCAPQQLREVPGDALKLEFC